MGCWDLMEVTYIWPPWLSKIYYSRCSTAKTPPPAASSSRKPARHEPLVEIALDVKVILTPPCVFIRDSPSKIIYRVVIGDDFSLHA